MTPESEAVEKLIKLIENSSHDFDAEQDRIFGYASHFYITDSRGYKFRVSLVLEDEP